MVEDDGGALVGRLAGLPRVDHEPVGRGLDRKGAHRDPVLGLGEAFFHVGVGYGRIVARQQLVLVSFFKVVLRHFCRLGLKKVEW